MKKSFIRHISVLNTIGKSQKVMKEKNILLVVLVIILSFHFTACGDNKFEKNFSKAHWCPICQRHTARYEKNGEQYEYLNSTQENTMISEVEIPGSSMPYADSLAFRTENGNVPEFSQTDKKSTEPFEKYSSLDSLGRCGVAYANICIELMPTTERGEIGMIKPSGWHTVKYDVVDGKYLYNRCHLIGYQLAGENANEENLITGTRYMNVTGMLPFENFVADYVEKTDNHVLYRVTPEFSGNNLVADGVKIEAYSVEDNGMGVCFNVFVYNIQPGISIDYATGDSALEEDEVQQNQENDATVTSQSQSVQEKDAVSRTYILNTNTKKFHNPDCKSVSQMKDKNKKEYEGTREEIISQGYAPCKNCNP